MLSFDIRTLDSSAAQVSSVLSTSDEIWGADDLRPLDGVKVEGRLSAAGGDRFYFSGRISGTVQLDCRRCLTGVEVGVEEDVQFIFSPAGDSDTEDDPDVFVYDAGVIELDIRSAVREAWLLAVPSLVQCKPDCKGLCLQCGNDLNVGACSCAPTSTDSRWEALRDLA